MITLKTKVYITSDKLNLGCGKKKVEGFMGMDIVDYGQEIVWDIRNGIPLPNDSISEIYSTDFIEHLRNEDIDNLIHEIIRVCKNGATVQLRCPHSDTDEAYYSGHLSLWDRRRFCAICKGFSNDTDRILFGSSMIYGKKITAYLTIEKQ